MRRTLAWLVAASSVAACSAGQPPTFTVTSASADATHWCPGNADNAPYDVHATVDVRNGTSGAVTITAVTARMTLEAVSGHWLETVGDTYDPGPATFSPATVNAGSSAALDVTFKSACTSAAYGTGPASYGDYRITFRVATSGGSYTIAAKNLHRILAAA